MERLENQLEDTLFEWQASVRGTLRKVGQSGRRLAGYLMSILTGSGKDKNSDTARGSCKNSIYQPEMINPARPVDAW